MASAWEQAGEIQKANSIRRKAKVGVKTSMPIFERLISDKMAPHFLRIIAPYSRASNGPLDPAFRRLSRPFGPVAKRSLGKSVPDVVPVVGQDLRSSIFNPQISIIENTQKIINNPAKISTTLSDNIMPNGMNAQLFDNDLDDFICTPTFEEPMYLHLQDISKENFLPGLDKIPQNTVGLLKINRRFLESYMVGLNHEFASKLLWRGFPTDQKGTYFAHFWDKLDDESDTPDIANIDEWNAPLGDNNHSKAAQEKLVLLIRGELLLRYPNALIYAVDKVNNKPNSEEFGSTNVKRYFPLFSGSLPPDLTFLGFEFTPEEAKNKYFVLEEHLTEPRFGLDESQVPGDNLENNLENLSWANFDTKNNFPDKWNKIPNDLSESDKEGKTWWDAANRASYTFQKPMRVFIPGKALIPSNAPMLIYPAPGAVFDTFPRATTLRWHPVSQAVSYSVELDCMSSGKWSTDVGKTYQIKEGLNGTTYNFNWVGAQKGRWRVWAKLGDGTLTDKSVWREFDYTR